MKKIIDLFRKIKENKIIKFIYGFLKALFTLVIVLLLIVIIAQKVSSTNNDFTICGLRIYAIATGSMEPVYDIGDIIITQKVNPADIKVGDVVTYLGAVDDFKDRVITHKIVQVIPQEDGTYHYVTRGDANQIDDPEITYAQVYGKVIYHTVILSYVNKVINNTVAYFIIFTIVGITASYQIITSYASSDDDDEDDTNEGREEEPKQ